MSGRHSLSSLTPAAKTNSESSRRIDVRQGHAHGFEHMLDAVLGEGRLVRLLRRERDGAAARHVEPVAEQGAQLVLRGDHGDACAGIMEGLHDRGRAHEPRVVHHHFLPRRGIVEVIAGDAVNAGRSARDDRDVVGVGEARDDASAPAGSSRCASGDRDWAQVRARWRLRCSRAPSRPCRPRPSALSATGRSSH